MEKVENTTWDIENTNDIVYNTSGIEVYREINIMQTKITLGKNNEHYMTLYTYIENNKVSAEAGKKNLLFIDCYDSLSEAEKQAQLNCIDLSKLSFYAIQVNMSGTVFDTLCTEDVNRLADMYEKHKQQIISSYKKRKNKKMTFDMFVIGCLKKFESNLSIIRGIKDIKSDKHDIKFLSKRKIVVYNIIDEEVIVNCDMVTGW